MEKPHEADRPTLLERNYANEVLLGGKALLLSVVIERCG